MKLSAFCLTILCCFSFLGCKKESGCSTYYFQALLNGIQTEQYCFRVGQLEEDTFTITTFAPNQQTESQLDVLIRSKKTLGLQNLDTAVNKSFSSASFILYKDYYTNRKTYSLYSDKTWGALKFITIDEDAKMVTGVFNGLLCEIDSTNDTLFVSNAIFSSKYR